MTFRRYLLPQSSRKNMKTDDSSETLEPIHQIVSTERVEEAVTLHTRIRSAGFESGPGLLLLWGFLRLDEHLQENSRIVPSSDHDHFHSYHDISCLHAKLLLTLASTVILCFKLQRTHDHTLLTALGASDHRPQPRYCFKVIYSFMRTERLKQTTACTTVGGGSFRLYILEVAGLNLSPEIGFNDWVTSWFPSGLVDKWQDNAKLVCNRFFLCLSHFIIH